MSIDSMMLINHLILCSPLVLLPSNYLNIRVFSSELDLHIRCQKYWSFNFSISTSNEYSRLISLRTDCIDFLAVQGTHKGLQHNLKASVLQYSAVYRPALTSGKTIALNIWTFVGGVMSMLFNTLGLSQLFFQAGRASFSFMAVVTVCIDFGAQENKICHCFHIFPFYLL